MVAYCFQKKKEINDNELHLMSDYMEMEINDHEREKTANNSDEQKLINPHDIQLALMAKEWQSQQFLVPI